MAKSLNDPQIRRALGLWEQEGVTARVARKRLEEEHGLTIKLSEVTKELREIRENRHGNELIKSGVIVGTEAAEAEETQAAIVQARVSIAAAQARERRIQEVEPQIPKDLEALNLARDFLMGLVRGVVFCKASLEDKEPKLMRMEDLTLKPLESIEIRRKAAADLVKLAKARNELTGGKTLNEGEDPTKLVRQIGEMYAEAAKRAFGDDAPRRGETFAIAAPAPAPGAGTVAVAHQRGDNPSRALLEGEVEIR